MEELLLRSTVLWNILSSFWLEVLVLTSSDFPEEPVSVAAQLLHSQEHVLSPREEQSWWVPSAVQELHSHSCQGLEEQGGRLPSRAPCLPDKGTLWHRSGHASDLRVRPLGHSATMGVS